ncbi:MAG: DUF1206 domain-containing protein [Thermomicrobiales bacterium]
MAGSSNMTMVRAEHQARESARKASPWLIGLGRLGHAAKGVVYLLIGALAVQVALGRGGEMTDTKGALVRIAQAPFGRFLLIAMAVGIAGFVLWRALQALLDTDNEGTDAKGLATRLGYVGSAVAYTTLALSAVQLLRTGSAGKNTTQSTQDWTAKLLDKPFGQFLVGVAGLVVIGLGGYQLYKGVKAKFREDLELGKLGPTENNWVTRLGQLGHIARGLVFGLIGLFLIVAALHHNPDEARGIDSTLATLAQQPFGPWLLGAVALGFVAYGLYMFAEARYRRMVVT